MQSHVPTVQQVLGAQRQPMPVRSALTRLTTRLQERRELHPPPFPKGRRSRKTTRWVISTNCRVLCWLPPHCLFVIVANGWTQQQAITVRRLIQENMNPAYIKVQKSTAVKAAERAAQAVPKATEAAKAIDKSAAGTSTAQERYGRGCRHKSAVVRMEV